MSTGKAYAIYLLSDGTCRTCEQVVKAALGPFHQTGVRLVRKGHVHSAAVVTHVIQKAARERAVVFYTLVSAEARTAIQEAARQRLVPVVDVLGPALVSLHDLFHSAPRAGPDVLYTSNQAQSDRIAAVEYTLSHDDGCGVRDLSEADVVLVGVSRTSKSATCFYLAYSGIRAANVPLFTDSEPPAELLKLDPRRVIGLTMNPHRLESLRKARLRCWGQDMNSDYADALQIGREIRAAYERMTRHGWRCIDVSYKAIEEVAREVRQLLADAGLKVGARNAGAASTPEERRPAQDLRCS